MKILTWNINGVRAVQRGKASLKKLLDSLGADVVCLQETKVTRDMLDEPTAIVDGYESYFSFSRKKTGYSGTANYCKMVALPSKAEEGLTGRLTVSNDDRSNVWHYGNVNSFTEEQLQDIDEEGRCVITQHSIRFPTGDEKEVAIINVYVPRAGERVDRHKYKLEFLTVLQIRAEAILKAGVHVIILGDINTTHTHLDNCDYQADEEFQRKSSRIWLNQILHQKERDKNIPLTDANLSEVCPSNLEGGHFSDIFRRLHPLQENAFTNWCTLIGARQTNFGRRLDYILVDKELAKLATHCEIMPDVHGSDHCPVILTLNCSPISTLSSPSLCSKFMPEFRGQQKKLTSFFTKGVKPTQPSNKEEHLPLSQTMSSTHTDLKIERPSVCESSSEVEKLSQTSSLKRNLSVKSNGTLKKAKLKKGASDTKQISLTSFFSQPKRVPTQIIPSTTHSEDKICGINGNALGVQKIQKEQTIGTSNKQVVAVEISHICQSSDRSGDNRSINSFNSKSGQDGDIVRLTQSDKSVNSFPSSPSPSPTKSQSSSSSSASAWKGLLGGLPPPPLCPGHKEPSVLRTVKKSGPNKNKQFYVCSRPDGAPGNPESRCNFFQWLTKKK